MADEKKDDHLLSVVSIEVLVDGDWIGSMTPYRVRVTTRSSSTLYRPMSATEAIEQAKLTVMSATPTDPRKARC